MSRYYRYPTQTLSLVGSISGEALTFEADPNTTAYSLIFPPSLGAIGETLTVASIDGTAVTLAWGAGGGGGAVWGDITGDITDQLDLMALLNDKAPIASPTLTGQIELNPSGASSEFLHVLNDGSKDVLRIYLPGSATAYSQWFLNSSKYLRQMLAGAIDNYSIQSATTDGIHFWLITSGSANGAHWHLRGSAYGATAGRLDLLNIGDSLQASFHNNGDLQAYGAYGGDPQRETSSTTVTVASGRAGIIADYGSLQASATYTMPASPFNGMEIYFAGGTNGVTALTLSPNSGQSIVGAITALTAGTYARYVYVTASTTWYRVG